MRLAMEAVQQPSSHPSLGDGASRIGSVVKQPWQLKQPWATLLTMGNHEQS